MKNIDLFGLVAKLSCYRIVKVNFSKGNTPEEFLRSIAGKGYRLEAGRLPEADKDYLFTNMPIEGSLATLSGKTSGGTYFYLYE